MWAWLTAALAKVGRNLLRPRDQRPLDDHSSRQTNVLSKVENTFIVHLPDQGERLIGNFTELPDSVLQEIRKQFEPRVHSVAPRISIRILRDDFADEVNEFQAYLGKEEGLLRNVEPYLEPQYASILRLAAYAKSYYDAKNRGRGDEVRNQIGLQYGRAGRKLCNLYLKGYVSEMFQHYLEPILTSGDDVNKIRSEVNGLLRTLIRFSENVHFIHLGITDAEVIDKVRKAVESDAPYVAIHSAGTRNVRKAQRIMRELEPADLTENGYQVHQLPSGTAKLPFLDIIIEPAPKSQTNP